MSGFSHGVHTAVPLSERRDGGGKAALERKVTLYFRHAEFSGVYRGQRGKGYMQVSGQGEGTRHLSWMGQEVKRG